MTELEKIELEKILFGVGFGRTSADGALVHAPSWDWKPGEPRPDVVSKEEFGWG